MNKEIILSSVCQIARQAGMYLREERKKFSLDSVEKKNTHDYVSYVDRTSEQMIVEALKRLLPEAGFITEEKTTAFHDEPLFWVIDPLDGTTNYIHGMTPYAVSIALNDHEGTLIGVVYEVGCDECFSAMRGGGAYLNDKAIHVSTISQIDGALLGIELPYQVTRYRETGFRLLRHYYGLAGAIRMNGSAATSLCYVAAGRFDGWIEKFLGPWDFAAGVLIIREAGGVVTDFSGQSATIEGNEIVASNGNLQGDLLVQVRG